MANPAKRQVPPPLADTHVEGAPQLPTAEQEPEDGGAFASGELRYLVPGSLARLRDVRRTRVRLGALNYPLGMFDVEILEHEDRGARWSIPFEDVPKFEFPQDACTNSAATVKEIESRIAQLDRSLIINAEPRARTATLDELEHAREDALRFLTVRSPVESTTLDPSSGLSRPDIAAQLRHWMTLHGADEIEEGFVTSYVSNPWSGENVKGHAIALAELGLARYDGKAPRSPVLLEPASLARRKRHIVLRLAFVHAIFAMAHITRLRVYRGMSSEQRFVPKTPTLVSTTLRRDIGELFFTGNDRTAVSALLCWWVPVSQVFMTYMETAGLNRQFAEAEAVLIVDSGDPVVCSAADLMRTRSSYDDE